MRKQRMSTKLLAVLAGVSLVAAACGDDDDGGDGGDSETTEGEEPEGTDAEGTDAEGTDAEGTDAEGTDAEGTEPEETDGEDGEAVQGGEIVDVSAFAGDPPSHIDPLLATTVSANQVHGSVYDNLTQVDYSDPAEPVVRGLVAESWETNDDATVWTFTIRDGLSFSDGTPVLPSSFKHGWEIGAAYGGNYSYIYGFLDGGQAALDGESPEISGVVADDEAMTLEVTLADGWAEFDAVVSHGVWSPMPESRQMPGENVDPDAASDWEASEMIGNGPFILESWEPDFSEVVMVPNPEWNGTLYDEELGLPEQPYLDKVTFQAFQEIDTGFNFFEAGDADVAAIPSGQTQYAIDNYETLIEEPALGAYYFQINGRNEMIGGEENLLLRQAISQAIDREDINQVVYDNTRTLATGITPEGIPGWEEGLCDYCMYDPEAAQAAFDEWVDAGNTLEEPIPIQFNEGFGHEEVVAIMVENLGAVGIDAVADGRSSDTYFDELANGECVICRSGWLADYPTYGNFMFDLFHGSALDGNNYGYLNEEFDALLEEAQTETDADARGELYRQAESMLLNEDVGTIPINWYNSTTVYNGDVISELYEDPSFHIHWETIQLAG